MNKKNPPDQLETPAAPEGNKVSGSAASVAAVSAGPVIYLGPPLLKPVHLAPNTVYRNGLPTDLAALLASDADLQACMVPVAQAGHALRGQGSADLTQAVARVANRYLGRR